jgi:acyl-CoA reductase-like NAD-dependent aldehyde dehydrogenase
MQTLRRSEIRDKYSGEVIGEVAQDTRRDLRAKIHRAFHAKDTVRKTSFEERAELGRRMALRLEERRPEFEDLMVREGGQPRKWSPSGPGSSPPHRGGKTRVRSTAITRCRSAGFATEG